MSRLFKILILFLIIILQSLVFVSVLVHYQSKEDFMLSSQNEFLMEFMPSIEHMIKQGKHEHAQQLLHDYNEGFSSAQSDITSLLNFHIEMKSKLNKANNDRVSTAP